MKQSSRRFLYRTTAGMALVTQFSMSAMAQEAATPPAGETELEEVVVTGTQLRGVAPVGTNVVSMSREDVVATGAPTANEILAKVPQVTSAFLSTPTTSLDAGLALIRPNIRGLGASGTSTTLVIIDGHRVVGAGVLQSTPDPDVIPPGILERVDIVPDGGSSIYGSDAIGGVINYISRTKFDGLEVSGRTGFADEYRPSDVNVTAGKDWGSGSGYLSYSWAHNGSIYGRDRDYVVQVTPNSGYCGAGTIVANNTTYQITSPDTHKLTPGTMSSCDTTDGVSFWPESTRNNVFAGLNQELTSSATLDVRGYYAKRELTLSPGLDARNLTVTAANPFFNPIAGETSQTVRTNFLGVIDQRASNSLTSYGVTPTLTVTLGANWQLRAMANFGRSKTDVSNATVNQTVAQNTLNPYDLSSNTPAALAAASQHNLAIAYQKLKNYRAILDGSLFQLPGGNVRLAAGVEYVKENHDSRNGVTAFGAEDSTPTVSLGRHVNSVFSEIAVPIVGAGNAISGVHSLMFSASGRYDDYSDVGGTFNPKLSMTYEPIDWIQVRGNWGRSFNAPSLVDKSGVQAGGALPSFVQPFGQTAPWAIFIAGNSGDQMKPQTAKTWSAGFDIEPPAVAGLKLSATYYNIDLEKVIGLLAGLQYSPELAPFFRDNVPCAQAAAELANVGPFPPLFPISQICTFTGGAPAAIFDYRVQNLGEIKTDGIDFNIGYDRPVSFGALHAGLGGTYTLDRDRALVPGAAFVETLDQPGASRLALVATLGARAGNLSASASLNHRGAYSINPVVAANPSNPFPNGQDRVASFTTVDLFFDYKLPEQWLRNDLDLSLNVTNLLDRDPPFYSGACFSPASCGFTNGSTLGRLVQVGLRAKF